MYPQQPYRMHISRDGTVQVTNYSLITILTVLDSISYTVAMIATLFQYHSQSGSRIPAIAMEVAIVAELLS